jgi:uncharacterized OsmC-like protein
MQVVYDGNVHTLASHSLLREAIPLGNCGAPAGEGAAPNPIDLLCLGLASCLLIVMGKAAEAEGLDIVGAKADAKYDLVGYRIARIGVTVRLPRKLLASDQAKLEAASRNCPVFVALHPDVDVSVTFVWPE